MGTKNIAFAATLMTALIMTGCASVPMADTQTSEQIKRFNPPSTGKSGVYVYRDSFVGKALKKDIYVDGNCLGESADKVFFYTEVDGDKPHILATESEFSENLLTLNAISGKNHFIRQYIKLGVFVGGANLEEVDETTGKAAISKLNLAVSGHCDKQLPKKP